MVGGADQRNAAERNLHRPHGAGADGEDQLQVEKVPDAAAGKLGGGEEHP